MGPFRGPYRGSPLRDPCWWVVTTEVAAHWEEVLMGPFRGGTHKYNHSNHIFILFKSFIHYSFAYLLFIILFIFTYLLFIDVFHISYSLFHIHYSFVNIHYSLFNI